MCKSLKMKGEHFVVTTNANDSRPKDSMRRDDRGANQNRNYNKSERTYNKSEGSYNKSDRPYRKNERSYNKSDKPFNKSERSGNTSERSYSRSDKPFNKGEKSFSKDGGNRPYNRDRKPNSYGRDMNKGGYGKDDDYEVNRFSKGSGKDQRTSKSSSRDKEAQPDKAVAAKRLEKEKKAMRKKTQEGRRDKVNRLQPKKKRTNNIDWTRGYENGLYGDDDDDDYSLYI